MPRDDQNDEASELRRISLSSRYTTDDHRPARAQSPTDHQRRQGYKLTGVVDVIIWYLLAAARRKDAQ